MMRYISITKYDEQVKMILLAVINTLNKKSLHGRLLNWNINEKQRLYFKRSFSVITINLIRRNLSADFSTRVEACMNIIIPLPGEHVGFLRFAQLDRVGY